MAQVQLRQEILDLVATYARAQYAPQEFIAGKSIVSPSGKVLGVKELQNMVEASLDGWLTAGRFNEEFQRRLAIYLGVPYVLTTNSGSSANLLALTALSSYKLGARQLKPGDEVITVAAGFPTTVNPIIQNKLIPVFIDFDLSTYNVNADLIEAAISSKTKAIILAHTLGNPFDIAKVKALAEKYELWLIEDCCDALGSTYNGQLVGAYGDIATLSFYPAHHITMGEGGAIFTKSKSLYTIIESIRDWGRDCYWASACDNTCGKRFEQQFGSLAQGYDHKYTYSHLGYNLKISDMQAACDLAKLDRIESFINQRKVNFNYLKNGLYVCEEFISLAEATENSDPSWFGFPITIRAQHKIKRVDLLKFLDQNKIGTRLLFAGNLTHQPYFEHISYRIHDDLKNTDIIMNDTLWLGVYPGLGHNQLDYVIEKISEFFGLWF